MERFTYTKILTLVCPFFTFDLIIDPSITRGLKILYVLIPLLTSCEHLNTPPSLNPAIERAGENKIEIIKILKHYNKNREDSLKLKASLFLIGNMVDMYYYEGELLDEYSQYLKLIRRDRDHGEYYLNAFKLLYGPFSMKELNLKYDLEELSFREFTDNIELAFKVWKEYPWAREIPFEIFCEYILPYRINTEKPTDRTRIYETFHRSVYSDIKNIRDPVEVAYHLNEELKYPEWILTNRVSFLPYVNATDLLKYKAGTCKEMSQSAIYVMRAMGVPVAIDFLPQWPYRDLGHTWNVVFDKNGRTTMFEGAEDSPGTPHKPGTKKAKVFRFTFSQNPSSLAMQKDKDKDIPSFLQNPRIKDVSEEYFSGFDIKVPIVRNKKNKNRYAYLSVFDNKQWLPVNWGKIEGKEALYSKMEGDIVYLPSLYTASGIIAANYPFLLTKEGAVVYLKPDSSKLHKKIVLSSIFPITPDLFTPDRQVGGVFQGANSADFKGAQTLDSIRIKPLPFWNEVSVIDQQKFRYVRYLSSMGGHCNIGELEFYNRGKKLKGVTIGTPGSYDNNPKRTKEKAIDGDMTTFFDSKNSSGAWVGLDLKRPTRIEKIRYSVTMMEPEGKIIKGHIYELSQWTRSGKWTSLGRVKADGPLVSFENIPSNSLYILRDKTQERNSRIFTISNGKVVWR